MVLFDEIEKAHPDVFHTLLQLLDDGRLTDSHGRTASFKNTIVLLTSNLGSLTLLEGIGEDGQIRPDAEAAVRAELRASFRPEFLNRIDDTVFFKPLRAEELERIVDLLTADVRERLAALGGKLELTAEAREFIAREGSDAVYGARPLKRFLQRELETPLARKVLEGNVGDGVTVEVTVRGGELDLRLSEPEAGPAPDDGSTPAENGSGREAGAPA